LASDGTLDTAVVLFSGGPRSTLAAIRTGLRFQRVHLVTMTHKGYSGSTHLAAQAQEIARFFGDPDRFVHRRVPVDRLVRLVTNGHRWRNLKRHGLLSLAPCGLCRLAVHWRALVYCLDNGIEHLADGLVPGVGTRPGGYGPIGLDRLREVHGDFGVHYETPLYDLGVQAEKELERLRFTGAPGEGTGTGGHHGFCKLEKLDALFRRACIGYQRLDRMESRMTAVVDDGLARIRDWTREYAESGARSRLAACLDQGGPWAP